VVRSREFEKRITTECLPYIRKLTFKWLKKEKGNVGSNATSSHPTEMNSALTVELPYDR